MVNNFILQHCKFFLVVKKKKINRWNVTSVNCNISEGIKKNAYETKFKKDEAIFINFQ